MKRPHTRCETCQMRHEFCLCAEIEKCRLSLRTQTKVFILMHHRERHLPTNTGRLAALTIPDCEIRYRGLPGNPLDTSGLIDSEREVLFLYPHEGAQVLNKTFLAQITKPISLIVPDGSWRQAFKVAKREEALKSIPRVTLESGALSQYKLRREPKAEGLATFEAIARALGVIENPEAQEKLEQVFHLMVERTLKSRGYSNPATRP